MNLKHYWIRFMAKESMLLRRITTLYNQNRSPLLRQQKYLAPVQVVMILSVTLNLKNYWIVCTEKASTPVLRGLLKWMRLPMLKYLQHR